MSQEVRKAAPEPRASGVRDVPPAPPGPHIAVVIPAFQAARTIGDVIAGIPPLVRSIIVVDDASADDTSAAARSSGDPRLTVLRHEENRGVGGAMTTGYRAALELGADVAVKMDADGQMSPAALPALLEPVLAGRADYAKGNRFYSSLHLRKMPFLRAAGNAGLSFLTKLSSGAWHVFDPTNGFTAVHRAALELIDWRRVHPRYFFESSFLVNLTVARAVIEDVPLASRYGDERSHLSIGKALVQFPVLHLKYALWRFVKMYLVHDFNACSVMTLLGLPLVIFGLADGIAEWIRSRVRGIPATTGTVMIPTLAIILGFQMLLQALTLDIGNAPRFPLQRRSSFGREPHSAPEQEG